MELFWQFFLLNIKPFGRTLLKRFCIHLLVATVLFFVMMLLMDLDINSFTSNIFVLCGLIPFVFSEYALRMESTFINTLFSWGYKRIYSYFLCKYLFAILISLVYTLLLYLASPIGMERALGYSFLSIGVMLCVGILTMPYNKNKLDLFDNAALKGNTGSKKITSVKINPAAVDPDDVEMLEDMILASVNEALAKADELEKELKPNLLGGM